MLCYIPLDHYIFFCSFSHSITSESCLQEILCCGNIVSLLHDMKVHPLYLKQLRDQMIHIVLFYIGANCIAGTSCLTSQPTSVHLQCVFVQVGAEKKHLPKVELWRTHLLQDKAPPTQQPPVLGSWYSCGCMVA